MKIAFISRNNNFAKPILELMQEKHEVSQFKTGRGLHFTRFAALLNWCDVAYFEWCDDLLQVAAAIRPDKPIVARLHRYEVYSSVLEKIDWSAVDLLISNISSPHVLDKFKKRVENRPGEMVVMPDGVDLDLFSFKKREWELPWKCACVGTIMPRKGQYELIRMFADLDSEDYHLTILGKATREYLENCHELRDSFNTRTKFTFKTAMPKKNVAGWLQSQHVIISNSRDEGNHTVIKEAMATGCYPLVNAWLGADKTYPEANIFNTPQSFTKMLTAWTGSSEKSTASQEMRSFVEARYDVRKSAQRVVECVESVAK